MGVFLNNVDGLGGQVLADALPGVAPVGAAVNIAGEVVIAVAVQGEVDRVLVLVAGGYAAYPEAIGEATQALPVDAPVSAAVHQSVITARIKQTEAHRGFLDGRKRPVGHVARPAPAGKVTAEHLEVIAPVEAAVEVIGAHVEDVRLVGADQDGGLPVPAVGPLAEGVLRRDEGAAALPGVEAEVVAELEAYVDGFLITGVHLHLHPVAPEEHLVGVLAVLPPAGVGLVVVGSTPGTVIL